MGYIAFDPKKPLDVIPVGRVAIDFNPADNNRPLEESRVFHKYVGGSPANIAVGLARLHKKTGFIGKVSDDAFGRFVVDFFCSQGIDTSNIRVAKQGESLGLTFTEMKSPTESSILMYRTGAADLSLEPGEVDETYISQTKILLVSGTALAASPSREAVYTAMEYARKQGVKIVFDIDFRDYTWKNRYEMAVYYTLAARASDILLGSREEFTLMEMIIDPGNECDIRTAERWLKYGNQIVVIKHGKQGSSAYTGDGASYSVKPFPIDVLKSFGGGDGYASAFLYALLEGWKIPDALEFASASASLLVSAHSCSEAMPSASEIKAFIREKKEQFGEDVIKMEVPPWLH